MRVALAILVMGLAGCPKGDRPGGHRGEVSDGLAIAIYTGFAPVAGATAPAPAPAPAPPPPPGATQPESRERKSIALVDDRRTVEVDPDGTLRLADFTEGIELASLIVEPLDGARFVIESCARDLSRRDPLTEPITVVTAEGVEVTGVLRHSGDRRGWAIEDAEGRTHFVTGTPDRIVVRGDAALQVKCKVDAATGAHRVRLAYATTDLSWRASYRIDIAAGADGATATVQPTFTIAGASVIGARRASVSLLTGLPGGEAAPKLAWRGEVDLGSDEISVQPTARVMAASLDHVYRGGIANQANEDPRSGYSWRAMINLDVWLALGIPADVAAEHGDLPGGDALIAVTRAGEGEPRLADGRWPEPPTDDAAHGLDVWLWPSSNLTGYRERRILIEDGARTIEQYLYSVGNSGDEPVTVWVEEELRFGASRRQLRKQWPVQPQRRGDLLRFKIVVKPKRTERLGFEAEYTW